MLVVGGEDVESQTVGVNQRKGEVQRGVPLNAFIEDLEDEVRSQS